jgi:hypothetical protein
LGCQSKRTYAAPPLESRRTYPAPTITILEDVRAFADGVLLNNDASVVFIKVGP